MTRSLFRLIVAALLIGLSATQGPPGPPASGDSSIQAGNGPPPRSGDAPPGGDPRGERRETGGGGGPPGGGPPGGGPPGAEGHGGPPGEGGGPPGGGHERGPFAYKPSFSAAVGFAILYLILSLVTFKQLFAYKTWYFMLLPQAALGGFVGSVVRALIVAAPKAAGMSAMMAQMIAWQLPPSLLGIVAIFTFTRVVWWACPDERRTRRVLGVPPRHMSLCWSGLFVVPDMAKGIVGNFSRPKEGERPDPAGLLNRVQSGLWALQFFLFAAWMLWALRFMVISRRWPTAVDAAEKRWRQLGWATVSVGVLLSVCCLLNCQIRVLIYGSGGSCTARFNSTPCTTRSRLSRRTNGRSGWRSMFLSSVSCCVGVGLI
jgi:hypothetical protein